MDIEQVKVENEKLRQRVFELEVEAERQKIVGVTKEEELKDKVTDYEHKLETLQNERDKLQEQVILLQNQIFDIAKRPTTTINNNQRTVKIINHLAPYDLEDRGLVEEIAQMYFTKDTFEKGPEGIATMIRMKYMTDEMTEQPTIVCTDSSRCVFRYKDKQNKLKKDDKLKKTHSLLSEPLNRMNFEYYDQHDAAERYPFEANRKFLQKSKTFTSTMMNVGVHTFEE
jgi:hypothetical protein